MIAVPVGNDKRIVLIGLDISPISAIASLGWKAAEVLGIDRIGNIDKRRLVGQAADCVLFSCVWIGPAPTVASPNIAWSATNVGQRQM